MFSFSLSLKDEIYYLFNSCYLCNIDVEVLCNIKFMIFFSQDLSENTLVELKSCFMEAYDDNQDGKIDIREVKKIKFFFFMWHFFFLMHSLLIEFIISLKSASATRIFIYFS